ncbi:hypothetical protein [Alkalicoccus urumqiensis]|uniref:Uncharacterized protein n=1 Tax=Alkalicoccus urumqiensis TaxID=1548213 RepID=A0A2P6MHL9_ALKUR|nr:hypothetical protein [Alkalicoccus urumqiensis]PRO65782.1 hypothetical protein C6I21_07750 [Alkalicoccus urumqiensis]
MKKKAHLTLTAAFSAMMLLAACGGGGADEEAPAGNEPTDNATMNENAEMNDGMEDPVDDSTE